MNHFESIAIITGLKESSIKDTDQQCTGAKSFNTTLKRNYLCFSSVTKRILEYHTFLEGEHSDTLQN